MKARGRKVRFAGWLNIEQAKMRRWQLKIGTLILYWKPDLPRDFPMDMDGWDA